MQRDTEIIHSLPEILEVLDSRARCVAVKQQPLVLDGREEVGEHLLVARASTRVALGGQPTFSDWSRHLTGPRIPPSTRRCRAFEATGRRPLGIGRRHSGRPPLSNGRASDVLSCRAVLESCLSSTASGTSTSGASWSSATSGRPRPSPGFGSTPARSPRLSHWASACCARTRAGSPPTPAHALLRPPAAGPARRPPVPPLPRGTRARARPAPGRRDAAPLSGAHAGRRAVVGPGVGMGPRPGSTEEGRDGLRDRSVGGQATLPRRRRPPPGLSSSACGAPAPMRPPKASPGSSPSARPEWTPDELSSAPMPGRG